MYDAAKQPGCELQEMTERNMGYGPIIVLDDRQYLKRIRKVPSPCPWRSSAASCDDKSPWNQLDGIRIESRNALISTGSTKLPFARQLGRKRLLKKYAVVIHDFMERDEVFGIFTFLLLYFEASWHATLD